MDTAAHRVRRGGKAVPLGPTEFRLLRHFLEHPGRVFSRERLLDAVWGQDTDIELRTVDVHIRRLRKAINDNGGADVIRTVRSAGYARSEEHTSELQSLMRISYAVFCLKKKTKNTTEKKSTNLTTPTLKDEAIIETQNDTIS